MLRIGRRYSFAAAHWLPLAGDHMCARLHGHTYDVEIEVAGEVAENGMIRDFKDIDNVVAPVIAQLDHSCLNDTIDMPTVEAIASFLFEQFAIDGLQSVKVWESPRSWCERC
ncbi:MAG: 6-carboxytetrahydropterin synthase [Bradyrhizobium sp.]|nr:6-carboxytetrahydropterin synthase [Bradyrhizobium sp.]